MALPVWARLLAAGLLCAGGLACGEAEQAALPSPPVERGGPVIVRAGSPHRPAVTRPPVEAVARKLGTRTRNAISAATGFAMEVPDRADRLAVSRACVSAGDAAESACGSFAIETADASGARRTLLRAEADGGWRDAEIALPPGSQRVLHFQPVEHAGEAEPFWGSPLLLADPERMPPDQTPANVVLISLDTLAADSLGSFSGRSGVSPRIDALLSRSADFRQALAQYGNTLVSHASLFSALYPRRHGVYPDVIPGPQEASLVGELASAGYRTVAFTEGAFVSAAFGFSAGFDAYDDGMLGLSRQMAGGAAETFGRALHWLREDAGRGPFFLFLHTYEVHAPYLPRDEDAQRLADRLTPDDARTFPVEVQARKLLDHNSGRELLPPRDLERLRALHEAEVHTLDALVGDLVDGLAELSLGSRTLLVLTADHGDQFGEWGKVGHGDSLHDRVIHVPLAFHWPGVIEPRRIESVVQLVDVMPTVLELVDLPVPGGLDGKSLVPAIRHGRSPDRPAYAEQRTARGECMRLGLEEGCRLDRISVRTDRWQLVSSRIPAERRLYDLEADPRALRDVAAEHPDVADRLEGLARRYREAARREAPERRGGVDVDTLRRLRELGYVEPPGAAPPPSPGERF